LDEAVARQANRANLPPVVNIVTFCFFVIICNKKKAAMQQGKKSNMLRTNKLSSFITHQLSGFDKCLGGAYETDKIVAGGQKNEICRSV
jgi:hypothetical protein